MRSQRPESEPSTHDYARGQQPAAVPTPLPGPDTVGRSPTTRPEQDVLKGYQPVLGDYDLLHVAGEGGMGVVFQARYRPTGRIVALKILRPGLSLEPDLVARFRREIRIADVLRHPHIAAVSEVGEHNGRLYYTMPFAPTNLHRQCQRYGEPRAAARIMVTIAQAIHHAHGQAIIHRDLKPNNILLTAAHEPLIADFGLARWMDASQQLTQFGDLMGTPAYMAPEQAAGSSDQVGPAADVWSLGVILYELVAGQRPFEGGDTGAMLQLVRSADPPLPRQFRPDIDPGLEAVVLKCLRKKPSERYVTAAALADDLQRWLDGTPVRAQALLLAPPGQTNRTVRPRRYVAAAVLLALIPALLVLSSLWAPPTAAPAAGAADSSPGASTKNLEAVEPQLASGRPVEMALDAGGLRYFSRLLGDEQHVRVERRPQRPGVQVTADGQALLAVFPRPPFTGYRVEVRLRHMDDTGPNSGVGVFFGYATARRGDRFVSTYCRWEFNDRLDRNDLLKDAPPQVQNIPGPLQNRAELHLAMHEPLNRQFRRITLNEPGWAAAFVPRGRRDAARLVTVDVRPTGVTVGLDGRLVGRVPMAVIDGNLARWLRDRQPPTDGPLTFAPGGPVGLYLQNSTVVCESFRVTRLSD